MRRCLPALLMVLVACAAEPAGPGAGTTGGVTTVAAAATTLAAPTSLTAATTTTLAEPWAVVVAGDFGTGDAIEAAVAGAMASWVAAHPETRAFVTTGDNFYIPDVVTAWEQPFGWVARAGLAVWAVPGNHDLETPGLWLVSEQAFGSFPRWRTQEVAGLTFVLLDSNQVASADQQAWFEEMVAALAGRPWVAVFHHPVKSCSLHGSAPAVVERWGALLEPARLILSGHDHNYQRFEIPNGWAVVTGGGGHRLYDRGPCPEGTAEPVAMVSTWHFVAITGRGDQAVVTAYDVFGGVIDSFALDLAVRP